MDKLSSSRALLPRFPHSRAACLPCVQADESKIKMSPGCHARTDRPLDKMPLPTCTCKIPHTSTANASILSIPEIDCRLATAQEYLRKLHSERNNKAPACLLPPEILSIIFRYVPTYVEPAKDFCTRAPLRSWYHLTHVCHRWRAVALMCATLWTHVDISSPRWTALALKRSKRATLALRAEITESHPRRLEATKLALLMGMDRMSEIHVAGDYKSLCTLFDNVRAPLPLSAPRLRSLVLANIHWRAQVDIVSLPCNFLPGGAQRLERLDIQRCFVDWESLLFLQCPNLTNLTLHPLAINKPTMHQLLNILEGMPLLQTLELAFALPAGAPSAISNERKVNLPHLRTLSLFAATKECAEVLRYLALPPTTLISLKCVSTSRAEDISELAAAVASCQSRDGQRKGGRVPFQMLAFGCDPVEIHLQGWTASTSPLSSSSSSSSSGVFPDPNISLLIAVDSLEHAAVFSSVNTLFQNLPSTESVTNFVVDTCEVPLHADDWHMVFGHLPNLTTLHVKHDSALHLPTALSLIASTTGTSGRPEGEGEAPKHTAEEDHSKRKAQQQHQHREGSAYATVPRLDTLILHKVDFGNTVAKVPYLHLLQDCQISRSNRGVPIAELKIFHCFNIGKREVRTLCHLFSETMWDGEETYVDTTSEDEERDERDMWDIVPEWEFEDMGWHDT